MARRVFYHCATPLASLQTFAKEFCKALLKIKNNVLGTRTEQMVEHLPPVMEIDGSNLAIKYLRYSCEAKDFSH